MGDLIGYGGALSAPVASARLLDRIPDGVPVALANRLAPLLADRAAVSLVRQGSGVAGTSPAALPRQLPDWVVVDRTDPTVKSPCAKGETSRRLAAYRDYGYRTASADENGIVMPREPASR